MSSTRLFQNNGNNNSRASLFVGKTAAVVLYSSFPGDPRPQRETEALVAAGMEVDVVCLRDPSEELKMELPCGIRLTRLPIPHCRAGKLLYFLNYAVFLCWAFFIISSRCLKRRYSLVHVHNMPDILVFSALLPRWLGAKVILDLHDPMPELYQTIYKLRENQPVVRLLKWIEKRSIGFADLVLTPNLAFQVLFSSRSGAQGKEKIQIVMNSPEESLFNHRPVAATPGQAPRRNGEFRLIYHGLLADRHGLELLLNAVKGLGKLIDGLVLDVYGSGPEAYLKKVEQLIVDLGLEKMVVYHGKKPLNEIPGAIRLADLGIIPNRRSPFTELNFPTRIFEYLSMDKPVIAPNTRGIRDYFGSEDLIFFEPDDVADLERQILWVYQHPAEVAELVARGRRIYQSFSWQAEKARFTEMVGNLLEAKGA
jgi:glycosyltransferase involved in cell wall biosynthesis